jgi:hypothetical protein
MRTKPLDFPFRIRLIQSADRCQQKASEILSTYLAKEVPVLFLTHLGEEVGGRELTSFERKARLDSTHPAKRACLSEASSEGRRRRRLGLHAIAPLNRIAGRGPAHLDVHLRCDRQWPADLEGVDQRVFSELEPGIAAVGAHLEGIPWELRRPKEFIGQGARAEVMDL